MKAAGRVLLTAILCVLLVGFGVCGAYGAISGVAVGVRGDRTAALWFVMSGAIGLAVAWLCWRLIAGLWRKPVPPRIGE